jgi:hypothetical protein
MSLDGKNLKFGVLELNNLERKNAYGMRLIMITKN